MANESVACRQVKRNVLLNPGPATTTETVKAAQIVPDICPREQEFGSIMQSVSEDLVRIVHGEGKGFTSVLFCGSGTVCIDAALSSLLPQGKKALILNNGAYSSRGVEVCEYYGIDYVDLRLPFDRPVDVDAVREALGDGSDFGYVYTTHHETGTGVLNPIREIGRIVHDAGLPFIVDTTSSFAMIPLDVVLDNVDVCMASAQKGIQGMTGLSYIIAREDLLIESEKFPKRSYYTNLYQQYDYFKRTGQMHFTPPVQVIYAAHQALREYFEEGEQAKWNRHRALAELIHEGLAQIGFKEVIAAEHQSQLVVSVEYPDDENWNFEAVHNYCYERGFTIYPGKIAGANTFRLCTLGALVPNDIKEFMGVLADALDEVGCRL